MKTAYKILIYTLIFLPACHENQSMDMDFEYDPTVPYPILNPGDFWPRKFDQRGMQNAIVYNNKIYCNTIDAGGDNNYLYCLNPINGLVIWRAQVKKYASQPVFLCGGTVIYCSCLGDISTFDSQGKLVWYNKFDHPYSGHWVDTTHSRLLVKTTYWKNVSIYDINSGKCITDIKNDSLQSVIEDKIKNGYPLSQHKEYRFEWKGLNYIINCKPGEMAQYEIQIMATHK
jgi:outer membrane protein assembly factor BamB